MENHHNETKSFPDERLLWEASAWQVVQEDAETFFRDLKELFKIVEMDKSIFGKRFEKSIDHRNGFGLLLEDVRNDCTAGLPKNEDPEGTRAFAKRLQLKYDRVRKLHPEFGLPDLQVGFRAMADLSELPSNWAEEFSPLMAPIPGEDPPPEAAIPAPTEGLRGPYKDYFLNPQKYYFFELEEAYQAYGWDRVPAAAARLAMQTKGS